MATGSDISQRSTRSTRANPVVADASAPVPAAAAPVPKKTAPAKKAALARKKPKDLTRRSGIPTAWDPEVEDSTEVGFPNIIVQCYRNATLQLLLHAPVFCNWLNWYKNHHAPKGYTCQRGEYGKYCKVCQFQALCAVYWDGGVGKWKAILDTITKSVYDTWRADQEDEQSDIGEYLEQVVYQLREATKPMFRCDVDDALRVEMFEVKKCIGDKPCKDVFTARKEVFLRLGWPDKTEKHTPITDMVDGMFTKEDDTRPKCAKCGNPRVYTVQLGQPPELLLVQVNRLELVDNKINKIMHRVQMKEEITLLSTYFDERRKETNKHIQYELTAVVLHQEASAGERGHFTIAVKGRAGTWKLLDDAKVSEIDFVDLKRKKNCENAYIFSYRRMPTHDDSPIDEPDNDVAMKDAPAERRRDQARSLAISSNQGSSISAEYRSAQFSLTDVKTKELIVATVKNAVSEIYKEIKALEKKEKSKGTGDGESDAPFDPLDFQRGRGTLRITVGGDEEGGEKALDIWVKGLVHNQITEDKKEAAKKAPAKAAKAAKATGKKGQKRKKAGDGGNAKAKVQKVGKGQGKGKSKEPESDSESGLSELSEVISLSEGEEEEEEYHD
ncbi:hypothetical protein PENARI_c002G03951 [Penicillium arizonense]|uniref:USP domain-containing protein n=1 Tax=Penicillium arizonense TaxID=1835702 RepID=A0A1F5LWF4_PENAI|nr:hypothetical protein PENARI_c002G03951 [Penicillium arizonense]OGE57416.1 hypothetical protein PENARI_c002G03951 [Penicillium arizonense]